VTGFLKRLLGGQSRPLDYDRAKELAAHADARVRAELAGRDDVRPEILYFLAEDTSAEVRRQVAVNTISPPQANLLLASDSDERVRGDLAAKISRVAPGLSAHEQDRLRRMTFEALELLARDQIPRIRQILSEALKDVANAPPEVIRRLARDAELVVAAPVLQYSPVLTDEDLLEIIGAHPVPGALSAISRRNKVNSRVADAIAATDDIDAIAVLLGNASAQIREETLDRLADRAADIESWHRPLVGRPHLPAKTAQRLARFVADNLLQALAERQDLDPAATEAVKAVVKKRLDEMAAPAAKSPQPRQSRRDGDGEDDAAMEWARGLKTEGQLTEAAVEAALNAGNTAFVIAAVAVLAGLPSAIVRKVVNTESAKGMVALGWKAGMSPAFAAILQTRLMRLGPGRVLSGRGGNYPLTVDEMEWQLEFFGAQG
jgi:uncharacterized protein (DUF2336 family)